MLSKLVTFAISPIGTATLLGLGAIALHPRRPAHARAVALVAAAWLLVFSLPVVSRALERHLEAAHPPQLAEALPEAEAIVLLGGGIGSADAYRPYPDLVDGSDRVWHAARLYHAKKAKLLVLSGGTAWTTVSEAETMRVFLKDLGVPEDAMLLEDESTTTEENAAFTAKLLEARGLSRILLVTSATHMPRAKAWFEARGLEVIPAATDHGHGGSGYWMDYLPNGDALGDSARALKELVGRLVVR
jgi:uncharacterized SAM-binding protein YcdF (DUF218 family)